MKLLACLAGYASLVVRTLRRAMSLPVGQASRVGGSTLVPHLPRSAAVGLAMLLILAFAAPALAKGPGGNSGASAACENGGYLNWTRHDGSTFKNEGDCTRYAAKGGTLTPAVISPITLTYYPYPPDGPGEPSRWGVLIGYAVEPGGSFNITWLTLSGDWSVFMGLSPDPGQETGLVTISTTECYIDGEPFTSAEAVVTAANGVQTTYDLPAPDVCGYE